MATCSVTNCWNEAEYVNVGDRLRGSYCEEHADIARGDDPHTGGSSELERIGEAADRRGIESDLDRGDEDTSTPAVEKSGEVADSSAAKTDPSETIALEDEHTPLGVDRSAK